MWRVLCALSVLAHGAAAASLHPYVILAPDYGHGQVRRSDGGPPADNIMVAWPTGVRLPPRQVPLRFVAAMAVPVNTDPLLTQKELSEVVYYSSMDLRKINGTTKKKEAEVANEYYEDGDEEYYEDEVATSPASSTTKKRPTTTKPASTTPLLPPPFFKGETVAPPPPSSDSHPTTTSATPPDDVTLWTTSSSSTTAVRRLWTPQQTASRQDDEWLEAESIAFIVVGTCCGLSVLTLAVVLAVFRMRHSSPRPPRTESTAPSDTASEGGSSLRLPQRLINLMNDHSQSASTHKLGSWFNGRPTALSMHGASMAFPNTRVHNAGVNEADTDFSHMQAHNSILDTNLLEEDSSAVCSSVASQLEEDSLQRSRSQVEALFDDLDESVSQAGSTNSRHDTFIYWSSNSDRLV